MRERPQRARPRQTRRVLLTFSAVFALTASLLGLTASPAAADAPTVAPTSATTTATAPVVLTPVVTGTVVSHAATCVSDGAVCSASLVVPGEGTWAVNTTTGAVTFTAVAGFSGTTPARSYRVTDTLSVTGEGPLTVTVNPPAIPVVTARTVSVTGSTATAVTPTVAPTTFLVNASTCVVDPADSVCKTTVVLAGQGSFVVNTSTRVLTFTAVAGFTGAVPAVTYRVTDSYGQAASNTVTVTVNAPAVPVVTARTVAVTGSTASAVTPTVSLTTFLVGASTCVIDPADSVCKTTVTLSGQGSFVVNTSTRALTFTAVAGFTGAVPAVTYRVTDSYGQTASNTVTVTVNLPAAPVVTAATLTPTGSTAASVTPTVAPSTFLVNASTCVVDPADSVCKTTVVVAGKGTFVVSTSTRALTFTAVAGFTDAVPAVTYRVTDSYARSASSTVTVTVNLPAVPVVTARTVSVPGSTATAVTPTVAPTTFLVGASTCVVDPADSVCKTTVVVAGKGTFVVNTSTRALTFTAVAGFTGAVPAVTYRVTDSYGQTASNTVTVTVSLPAVPVVTARSVTAVGAAATTVTPTVTGTGLVNASTCVVDPADSVCKATVVVAGKGTFVVNTTNSALTFTAVSGFTGAVPAVTYRVTDSYGQSGSNTVTVTVSLPAAPVVTAATLTATGATAASVTPTVTPSTFLVNASTCAVDPADSVCKTTVVVAGKGTFVVNTGNRALTFTAVSGFTGAVPAVTYRVTDSYGRSASNTVTVTVNLPTAPVVTAATLTATGVTAASVTPTVTPSTFLVNASTCVVDPADSVCKTTVVVAGKGTFVVNTSTRALTFTAVSGFTGAVPAMTYRVTDSYGRSAANTVTVAVNLPAAPTVTTTTSTTPYNTARTVTPTATGTGLVNASTCVIDPTDSGCKTSVTVSGQGTWTVNTSTRAVTFTPVSARTGATTITYRVTDAYARTASAAVTITVAAPTGPVVTALTTTSPFNTARTVTPTATGTGLVNASTCVIDPTDSGCKTSVTVSGQGTWTVNTSTRAVTFTPTGMFAGAASVTYRVTDSVSQTGSNSVTVTVANPVAPVVSAATGAASGVAPLTLTPAVTGTSVDPALACLVSGASCVTSLSAVGQGQWTVNTSTGSVTFTANSGFTGAATAVTYRASDAYGQTGSNTVTVTVAAPAAPVVVAYAGSTAFGTATTFTPTVTGTGIVSASTCLVDGASCVASLNVAGQGAWTVNTTTRALTFTPTVSFAGLATSVTYRVTDAYGQTGSSTVAATVANPSAPTVAAGSATTVTTTPVVLTPSIAGTGVTSSLACLIDGAGCATTLVVSGQGTWTVNTSTGALTFTATSGFLGATTPVSYRATDAYGQSGQGSMTVTVSAASTVASGSSSGSTQSSGTNANGPASSDSDDPQPAILDKVPPVGGATVLVGGVPVTVSVAGNRPGGSVEVTGSGFALIVDPRTPAGRNLPLTSDGTSVLNAGGEVAVNGSGFARGSFVSFYLISGIQVRLLGTVEVQSDGSLGGAILIPEGIAPGTYTLQMVGLKDTSRMRAGGTEVVSVSLLVQVTEPKAEPKAARSLVYFDVLSSKLTPVARRQLDRMVARLTRADRHEITIVGFVGAGAGTANDQSLSRARAKAVERYLRSRGVNGTYVVRGAGQAAQEGPGARRAQIVINPVSAS